MADRESGGETERAARQPVVLVVEDEVLVRHTIAQDLREQGFTVIEAADAQEAIAVFASGSAVDAVFSDIHMPGALDGFGLARWIAQHHPATRVLLTSGNPGHRAARPTDESFFEKPYNSDAVANRIRALLKAGD
jgi:CheY-like chemotaxis protein